MANDTESIPLLSYYKLEYSLKARQSLLKHTPLQMLLMKSIVPPLSKKTYFLTLNLSPIDTLRSFYVLLKTTEQESDLKLY